jgi:hypothetical protein
MSVDAFHKFRREVKESTCRHLDEDAFGLIDVMIAFTILLIVLIPMVFVMTELGAQTSANSRSVTAGELAEQALESAGQLSLNGTDGSNGLLAALQNGITTSPVVNFEKYTSFVQLSWSNIGSTKNLCTSGAPPQVILATATVTWNGGTVTENTAINPPYGALNPNEGFVPVEVSNASGQGVGDVVITVADVTNAGAQGFPETFTTDANGCSFIQLPAGDKYSFKLGPPAAYSSTTYPYVGDNELPFPSKTMSTAVKTSGAVSGLVSFNYDISGSIALTPPSVTAVDGGVTCPSNTSTCFAMGQSASSATLFATSATSTWTAVAMPGTNRPTLLSAVACPTATQCYFVGSYSTTSGSVTVPSGTILSASLSGSTWTLSNATLTLTTGLTASAFTSVSCPGTVTCFASGIGMSGSAQQGLVATLGSSTWAVASPTVSPATTTLTNLPQIACPTSAQCLAVGSGIDTTSGTGVSSSYVFSYLPATQTLTVSPVTIAGSTIASVSSVTCPSATGATCFVTGSAIVGTTTTPVPALFVSSTYGSAWTQTLVTGALDLDTISCASSTLCLLPANLASGGSGAGDYATVFQLSLTAGSTPTAWSAVQQSSPSPSSGYIPRTACSSSTSCVEAGQAGPIGFVGATTGTAATVGATWTAVTLAASKTPGYFTGIACSGTFCVASGEGPSGDLLDSSSDGGATWSAAAGSVFHGVGAGQSAFGIPVSYTQASLAPVNTPIPSASLAGLPLPSSIGSLYPFPTAYSVFYGDCADEKSVGSLGTATVAGSQASQTSIGIGSLAVQIVDANGQPIPGAQLSVTTSDAACPIDTFQLPSTGASGVSQGAILNTPIGGSPAIPQPYMLTVTSGAHTFSTVSLTVSASGVVATSGGVSTAYHYPDPVMIQATS